MTARQLSPARTFTRHAILAAWSRLANHLNAVALGHASECVSDRTARILARDQRTCRDAGLLPAGINVARGL